MPYSRREIGKLALAGLPALTPLSAGKVDSRIHGVRIGFITYSMEGLSVDKLIEALLAIGVGEIELTAETAEREAGMPPPTPERGQAQIVAVPAGGASSPKPVPDWQRIRPPWTDEQITAARNTTRAVEMRRWRLHASMDRFKAVRRKFRNVGIDIGVMYTSMSQSITDDELDYLFSLAKALGTRAISTTTQLNVAKRVAPFATKHKMMVGFHGHDNDVDPNEFGSIESYDRGISYGKYNGINLDIGHFDTCNYDTVDFIRKRHARITNLHLKDRKKNHGKNMPWGQGETPIKEVLQLMRQKNYRFPANIELEYGVPPGSSRVAEVKKCLAYCREALA